MKFKGKRSVVCLRTSWFSLITGYQQEECEKFANKLKGNDCVRKDILETIHPLKMYDTEMMLGGKTYVTLL
jgi:hypothetical protein